MYNNCFWLRSSLEKSLLVLKVYSPLKLLVPLSKFTLKLHIYHLQPHNLYDLRFLQQCLWWEPSSEMCRRVGRYKVIDVSEERTVPSLGSKNRPSKQQYPVCWANSLILKVKAVLPKWHHFAEGSIVHPQNGPWIWLGWVMSKHIRGR
jgi:hypothetical protein